MGTECEDRLKEIVTRFCKCQNAFTAIGDGIRQSILFVLLGNESGGVRVGEIAQKTHLTRPTVSHHLQILKDAGMVAMRREGTRNYYYLSPDETHWKDIVDLVNLVYESISIAGQNNNVKGDAE